jgi:DNA-binding CsgD family transcriptional regulator
VWQTALARQMLSLHFQSDGRRAPTLLLDWLQHTVARLGPVEGLVPGSPSVTLETATGRRLRFTLHEALSEVEWMLVLREADDAAALEALALAFGLTPREAEALYWVAKGKTNRDIGEIVGASPATVKKHLEHVYEKLGVETRNAAAAVALGKVPQLGR